MALSINPDGSITIKLRDIVERLDTAAKTELVQQLACETDIIEMVCQQITTGIFLDSDDLFWHGDPSMLAKYRALLLQSADECIRLHHLDVDRVKSMATSDGRLDGFGIMKQVLIDRGWSEERAHDVLCEAIDKTRGQ